MHYSINKRFLSSSLTTVMVGGTQVVDVDCPAWERVFLAAGCGICCLPLLLFGGGGGFLDERLAAPRSGPCVLWNAASFYSNEVFWLGRVPVDRAWRVALA